MQGRWGSTLTLHLSPGWPGEARTEAMVKAAAGPRRDEDAAFDSFADPAGLIMANIIEVHCEHAPNRAALLAAAKALQLPNNPLVGLHGHTPSLPMCQPARPVLPGPCMSVIPPTEGDCCRSIRWLTWLCAPGQQHDMPHVPGPGVFGSRRRMHSRVPEEHEGGGCKPWARNP